jgi:hypothetical protein
VAVVTLIYSNLSELKEELSGIPMPHHAAEASEPSIRFSDLHLDRHWNIIFRKC